jgi:hypothetical protein
VPEQIEVGLAGETEINGSGFTLTVLVAVALQPLAFVPVTI